MSGRSVAFFAVLPIFIVLGHDIVLYTLHPEKGFMLSALGYIWVTYNPQGYAWVNQNIDEQSWTMINTILAQKSVVVFGVIAAIIALLTWIAGALKGKSRMSSSDIRSTKPKTGGFKYKRK